MEYLALYLSTDISWVLISGRPPQIADQLFEMPWQSSIRLDQRDGSQAENEADVAAQRRGHRGSHGLRFGPSIAKANWAANLMERFGDIGIGCCSLAPRAVQCQPGMAIVKVASSISGFSAMDDLVRDTLVSHFP